MSEENEKIESKAIQTENLKVEEIKKEESVKYKQEKIKVEKPKKKIWKKVFWAIVITLIIGIIGGAVGLYYLQEKTELWFIVPSALTRKVEDKSENNVNKIVQENKIINNTVEEGTEEPIDESNSEEEINMLSMDSAYEKLEELYNIGIELYLNYPASYFTVNNESHSSISDTSVEVIDYDRVINKYLTKSAKADYEEFSKNIITEENDKTYMELVNGVIGLDYLERIFTKIVISENEITCEVNNIYNGSFDKMKVTSEGNITLDTMSIELNKVKSKFVIKKVNDIWKIDEFDYEGMR